MPKRGVNKVTLIGNLGKDPETRFFPDGGAVTNATLATSESWKDRQTGEEKERTEWHRLVFRDRGNYKLGEWAGKWFKKGSKIYVEGALRTRKWQSQDGVDHYTTEIYVEDMQSMDPKPQGGAQQTAQPAAQPAADGRTPNPNYNPAAAASAPAQGQGGAPATDFGTFDDDIPF